MPASKSHVLKQATHMVAAAMTRDEKVENVEIVEPGQVGVAMHSGHIFTIRITMERF